MVRFLTPANTREEFKEGYYSIVALVSIASGLTSIAFFIFAEPIATALFDGRVVATQIFAAVIFLECMNGLQFNYFRTIRQISAYSYLMFFKTCLQLILVGALVFADYGISGAVMGLFITDLTLFLTMGFSLSPLSELLSQNSNI